MRVAVIGDRVPGFTPQEAIAESLPEHEVIWIPTEEITPDSLGGFDGIWCAPGSPYKSLDGALTGIRYARERKIPFIGTCAGFQHGVLEFALNVLGIEAKHEEYGGTTDLIIDELLCDLVGKDMPLDVVDPWVRGLYGSDHATERYYCRFGLNESYREQLEQHGLMVGAVDDGATRLLYLTDHPFFVLTLFVPQTKKDHPLVAAFAQTL